MDMVGTDKYSVTVRVNVRKMIVFHSLNILNLPF
jgi:hypothetical protein